MKFYGAFPPLKSLFCLLFSNETLEVKFIQGLKQLLS